MTKLIIEEADVNRVKPITLPDAITQETLEAVCIRSMGEFRGKAIWYSEELRPVIGVDEYGKNIIVFERIR